MSSTVYNEIAPNTFAGGIAGHFAIEDASLNMYQRIYEWSTDNGLF